MNDRDTFAAAALTGLLAGRKFTQLDDAIAVDPYATASYGLADAMLRERGETNHDAAPAAKARTDADRGSTDKAVTRHGEGTGDISEAQIDALECVVEDGRIVGMSVYGHLRSLLVRLRPEWEDESDRPKPISDERLAALEELSALDQELELKHGIQGNPMIKPRSNNELT